MKSWKRKALNAAVLTTLAVIGIQSAHAAAPIIGSSLQLNGLSFQLIDLDLNDGITPSFSLGPSGRVFAADRVDGSFQTLGELPISLGYGSNTTTPLTYTTPEGFTTVAVGANSLSLTSSLSANDASRKVLGPYVSTYTNQAGSFQSTTTFEDNWAETYTDLTVNPDVTKNTYDPVTGQQTFFFDGTLSANTLLVVTGQVSQNATMDRSAVLSAMGPQINRFSYAQTGSSLELTLGTATPGYDDQFIWWGDSEEGGGGISRSSFKTGVGLTYSPDSSPDAVRDGDTDALITDNLAQDNKSQTFTLVASNTSSDSAGMSLKMRAYSGASIINRQLTETVIPIDPSLVVVVPSIPEPSTYALMGLGLVGIAQVARRRKANA